MGSTFRIRKPKPPASNTLADYVANKIGSWTFIISQSTFLTLWIAINSLGPIKWDKPPFVLLNLMLSFQAAFTGPVLLMAANRQSEIDRNRDIDHYLIDVHDSQVLEGMSVQLEHLHKHLECDDGECHF